MKLLELIILLMIITVFLSGLSRPYSRRENMVRIETRRQFLQAAAYARSISILRQETIELVILPCGLEEEGAYIDLRAKRDGEKISLNYEWGSIARGVVITDFNGVDEYYPFSFTWTGNARNGTLEWKVGDDFERIIVNNRGRIYWQR